MKEILPIIAILAAGLLVGCGEDADDTAARDKFVRTEMQSQTQTETDAETESDAETEPQPERNPDSAALHVLRLMEDPVLTTLITARDRAKAYEAGNFTKAARLETRMNRQLKTVQTFGREARKRLLDVRSTRQAKAAIAAGDGWTEWAYELRTNPPALDFDQARHIADLAADAIAAFQDAYETVGTQPPPAFRSS